MLLAFPFFFCQAYFPKKMVLLRFGFSSVQCEFYSHVMVEFMDFFLFFLLRFCFHILVKDVASSVKSQLQSEPFSVAGQQINMVAFKKLGQLFIYFLLLWV